MLTGFGESDPSCDKCINGEMDLSHFFVKQLVLSLQQYLFCSVTSDIRAKPYTDGDDSVLSASQIKSQVVPVVCKLS